jgi:hypothetical protein
VDGKRLFAVGPELVSSTNRGMLAYLFLKMGIFSEDVPEFMEEGCS